LLRDLDIEMGQPVARLEQAFLSCVLEQIYRPVADNAPVGLRRLREQRSGTSRTPASAVGVTCR
jgi:hypothetical protein